MYEKQVHKDGIRRAVMTSMGSTTARYFDKEGLRKLFTLGPVGECEFLERLRDRGLASNENSPESRLTLHGGVIGVSSNDSVYSSKLVTIDAETNNEKENPFSSTPAPPRLPLSKTPTEKVETDKVAAAKVMGKSQRVLSKKRGKENLMQEKKKVEQVILNASSKARNIQRYSQPTEPEKEHNADPMRKIDNLRSSGSPVSALVMLMDLLENRYHDIAKGDKMEIHQRIASIAYELQWL